MHRTTMSCESSISVDTTFLGKILVKYTCLDIARLVVFHDELEGPKKVFLKVEVLQLALFQELERELLERIHREN